MAQARVAIICGSDSDLPVLRATTRTLDEFGVAYDLRVLSAHRSPEPLDEYLKSITDKSVRVIVCAAGMAAHLAGAVAAKTVLPVIGIPMACPPFDGRDSLLSTVQMPPGIPVLTVAAGKAGATNAALAAVQVLATADGKLRRKLKAHRVRMEKSIVQKNEKLGKLGIEEYVRAKDAAR